MKKLTTVFCATALCAGAMAQTGYGLSLEADGILVGGEQAAISLGMSNITPITLIQADLVLPEGVTVATDSEGEMLMYTAGRADGHVISANTLSDGTIRMLVWSGYNKAFKEGDDPVATIVLDVAPEIAEGVQTLKLANILLVEPTEAGYKPDDSTLEISAIDEETAVKSAIATDSDNHTTYNVAGVRVQRAGQGIFIKDGRKIASRK